MRFLTREVYDSWYGPIHPYEDPSQLDAAYRCHWQHLDTLDGLLPASVLELARLPGVDDGLVVEVHHVRSQSTLHLTLRCGDSQMGYYDLVLVYQDAILSSEDEWTLAKIARTTRDAWRHQYDLLFHELDLTGEGLIEHRLLFHEWMWFSIRCRDLEWSQISRPDRELPDLPNRFPGGTATQSRARRRRLHAEPGRR